jgi:hypothetical protein
VQETGGMSQAVTLTGGVYTLSFQAAQRATWSTSQTFQVLVDGQVVATVTPAGTSYTSYTTAPFAVTAGTHTIAFVGTDPLGGDNTALVDSVQLNAAAFTTPVASGVQSFTLGSTGAVSYALTDGTQWQSNGNPNAPEGSQVGFVQQTGSLSQSVTLAAGTYTLSFQAAQRATWSTGQTVQVLVDGQVVATVTPTGTPYASYTTAPFTVAAGAHTIAFVGTDPLGGDNTALVDAVQINAVALTTAQAGGGQHHGHRGHHHHHLHHHPHHGGWCDRDHHDSGHHGDDRDHRG